MIFFFNDTATTEIYTLSLHDALPIFVPDRDGHPGAAVGRAGELDPRRPRLRRQPQPRGHEPRRVPLDDLALRRSEEHTSELQSRQYLVCRLLLAKKKLNITQYAQARP